MMLDNVNPNTLNDKNIINRKSSIQNEETNYNTQSIDEFASAFPKWNLVPPAVVIKRVRRGI